MPTAPSSQLSGRLFSTLLHTRSATCNVSCNTNVFPTHPLVCGPVTRCTAATLAAITFSENTRKHLTAVSGFTTELSPTKRVCAARPTNTVYSATMFAMAVLHADSSADLAALPGLRLLRAPSSSGIQSFSTQSSRRPLVAPSL